MRRIPGATPCTRISPAPSPASSTDSTVLGFFLHGLRGVTVTRARWGEGIRSLGALNRGNVRPLSPAASRGGGDGIQVPSKDVRLSLQYFGDGVANGVPAVGEFNGIGSQFAAVAAGEDRHAPHDTLWRIRDYPPTSGSLASAGCSGGRACVVPPLPLATGFAEVTSSFCNYSEDARKWGYCFNIAAAVFFGKG